MSLGNVLGGCRCAGRSVGASSCHAAAGCTRPASNVCAGLGDKRFGSGYRGGPLRRERKFAHRMGVISTADLERVSVRAGARVMAGGLRA